MPVSFIGVLRRRASMAMIGPSTTLALGIAAIGSASSRVSARVASCLVVAAGCGTEGMPRQEKRSSCSSGPRFPGCRLPKATLLRSSTPGKAERAGTWVGASREVAQTQLFGAAPRIWRVLSSSRVDHGRTSPAGLSSFIAPDPHAGSGGGLGRRSIDPAQDLGEQGSRHRHLGQLEHHVAAVAHDPGADLDQLLAQRRQRPVLDLLRAGPACAGSWRGCRPARAAGAARRCAGRHGRTAASSAARSCPPHMRVRAVK